MLKQAAFTFSAPRPNNTQLHNNNNNNNHSMQFNFSSPGAGPSKSPMQTQSPPSQFDINFNSLIAFDPNMLNPAEDMDTNMDTSFSYSTDHYKTIASNPMFTSFAEPSPADSMMSGGGQQPFTSTFDFGGDQWTPPESSGQDALEQIFGGNFLSTTSGGSGVDFAALLTSTPSSVSPVSHASANTPSLSSSSSSPGAANAGSPSANGGSQAVVHGRDCPKTKAQLQKVISEAGQSSFVQSPGSSSNHGSPSASESSGGDKMNVDGSASCEITFSPVSLLKKATSEGTPFVMCKGSSFPKTQKSDKNIEVLTAWRTITSNPQFKVGSRFLFVYAC